MAAGNSDSVKMGLLPKSIWIFVLVLLLLLLTALFPSPGMILFSAMMTSALVLIQAYIILKDNSAEEV